MSVARPTLPKARKSQKNCLPFTEDEPFCMSHLSGTRGSDTGIRRSWKLPFSRYYSHQAPPLSHKSQHIFVLGCSSQQTFSAAKPLPQQLSIPPPKSHLQRGEYQLCFPHVFQSKTALTCEKHISSGFLFNLGAASAATGRERGTGKSGLRFKQLC